MNNIPPSPQAGSPPPGRPAKSSDRRAKLVFLVIFVIAGVLIYNKQTSLPSVADSWPNLAQALEQAGKENRRVLVLFLASNPSEQTRRLLTTTMAQPANVQAIEDGRLIQAKALVDVALTSELAVRYKITALPAMLLLDSEGKELNRRKGFIGEVPFRSEFLSCSVIKKP